ncbi:hypothetical protein [Ghiorsea bivora]|uniref:hypothetical protein n=1 Tax=Ghiorsea bivora TaxID=1485545 RepID=UPI00056DB6D0|nr:hypothetical protein [Ghiorsea bivora]
MNKQTSLSSKANQGRACGVIPFAPDSFLFVVGSGIAVIGSYGLIWTMAAMMLARKKETV